MLDVDDIIYTGLKDTFIRFHQEFERRFKIKFKTLPEKFIGLGIKQTCDLGNIAQKNILSKLLANATIMCTKCQDFY